MLNFFITNISASTNGHTNLVSFLLEKGLSPEQKCGDGYTPKDLATDSDVLELFENPNSEVEG